MSGLTSEVRGETRVVQLLSAATAEALAAGEALVAECVAGGARREWAETLVDDLGIAIVERSSWMGAYLAQHDAEVVDPARAVVALSASPALIEAYEQAVTLEQAVAAQ